MNFDLTEEQIQFSESLKRWAAKSYGFDRRAEIIHSEAGGSEAAWQDLASMGVTALTLPEDVGGFDGSVMDMLVVMEELGRGLVIEPCFSTALGAEILRLCGGQYVLLEKVATGQLKLACALGERNSRHDLFDISTTASSIGERRLLNGTKTVVVHGAQANQLVVSARSSGDERDTNGISLFLVPADAPGVSMRDYRTIDGLRAADVELKDVEVGPSSVLGIEGEAWVTIQAAADFGAVLLCGEALGVMEALNAATLEYLKTRHQFGVAIGTFQVLQHRMVDMTIHLAQARAIATLAAMRGFSDSDAQERRRLAAAAKARVGQAMRFISQEAIQLHGGIGLMDESVVAHYVKRLVAIEMTLGDTDHHLGIFASHPRFVESLGSC